MKKFSFALILTLLCFTIAACSQTPPDDPADGTDTGEAVTEDVSANDSTEDPAPVSPEAKDDDSITVVDGSRIWQLYGGNELLESAGGGKFKVIADGMTAAASDLRDPAKFFMSENGVLTLPAGSYRITCRAADTGVVYLNYADRTTLGYGTEAEPFRHIGDAIDALEASSAKTRKLVIVGNYTLPYSFIKHEKSITITGGTLTLGASTLDVCRTNGPITFENITLAADSSAALIEGDVTIGSGVKYADGTRILIGCADKITGGTDGSFKVSTELLAKRTDGKTYSSGSGMLGLPDGCYTLSRTDKGGYTIVANKLTVTSDCTLSLAHIRPADGGRLFAGWVADGKAPAGDSFKAGTVLDAKFADLSLKLSEVTAGKAGTSLLHASVSLDGSGRELLKNAELGVVYTDGDGDPTLFDGFAKADASGKAALTSLSGIALKYGVTLRGYLRYTDANGAEHVVYTDSKSALPYTLADASLKAEMDVLMKKDGIYSNAKDIVGTAKDKTTWIYQLADTGVMVREAEFDSGLGGDPVTVVHITDMHFNYCNAEDKEENDPVLMSTLKNRKWLANGSARANAERCMSYAESADQTVITGDVLDYLSHGAIEMLNDIVWDKDPEAIVTLGNHEPVRNCQGTVPENMTLEARYAWLEEAWADHHDIYYSSKIVDEKVMVIQMDNSQNKYWERQIEPFKADLALAREKGYTVLLFQHIPICSRNPAEAEFTYIRGNDTSGMPMNLYSGGIGYNRSNEDTAVVYDLITTNADIIKGIFCGHVHCDMYSEIIGRTADGERAVIPQYILTASAYDKGHVLKITVK